MDLALIALGLSAATLILQVATVLLLADHIQWPYRRDRQADGVRRHPHEAGEVLSREVTRGQNIAVTRCQHCDARMRVLEP